MKLKEIVKILVCATLIVSSSACGKANNSPSPKEDVIEDSKDNNDINDYDDDDDSDDFWEKYPFLREIKADPSLSPIEMPAGLSLLEYEINGVKNTLEPGDYIEASWWNDEESYIFNDEEIGTCPVLTQGVTLGTDLETVMKVFNIKPGYVSINCEYIGYDDYATFRKLYSDLDFKDELTVSDFFFTGVAEIKDGKLYLLPYDDSLLNNYDRELYMFEFDFCGDASSLESRKPYTLCKMTVYRA